MFYQISDPEVFTWWDGGQGINSFILERAQILDVSPRPIGKAAGGWVVRRNDTRLSSGKPRFASWGPWEITQASIHSYYRTNIGMNVNP